MGDRKARYNQHVLVYVARSMSCSCAVALWPTLVNVREVRRIPRSSQLSARPNADYMCLDMRVDMCLDMCVVMCVVI